MSDQAKLRDEILASIKDVKRLQHERLESMRRLRILADSLIANPATPPATIAAIEEQFAAIQAANAAHNEQMKLVADRYAELDLDALLSEQEAAA